MDDLPKDYRPLFDVKHIEAAIKDIKDFFERQLAAALNLRRVTAPLFVRSGLGINDDLNGVEQPVRFRVRHDGGAEVELVQSLAKWKRLALARSVGLTAMDLLPHLRREWARLLRGLEIDDVAASTKVNPTYLRFLEEERFDDLPAVVYVRGFVSAYARLLGIDPAQVAPGYVARCEEHRRQKPRGRFLGRR